MSGSPETTCDCCEHDFETCPTRTGTGCIKYDTWEKDVIPLCIADMDVRCSPKILDALAARVQHGVMGYGHETSEMSQIAIKWIKRHYDWDVKEDWLVWFPGIVSGMNAFIRTVGRIYSDEKELSVMVHVPAYPPFLAAPDYQRQKLVKVPLKCTVDGQHLFYEIDWEAFERCVDKTCKCFILCNPHNPTGRQWTEEEMKKLAEFCEKHDLYVLSDEIWADLVLEGPHIPFAKVVAGTPLEKRTMTMMAPSKTFNIAGLGCSLGIIPDKALHEKFMGCVNGIVPHINCLGLLAGTVAWGGECDSWHKCLLDHLRHNLALVEETLSRCPKLRWSHPQATFVVWIDPHDAFPEGVNDSNVVQWLAKEHHIGMSPGECYDSPGWIRMNIGCPSSTLKAALAHLEAAFGPKKEDK